MIIKCNSCEKEFVVPDNAITTAGRLVQCSSCGNKWTQYPIDNSPKKPVIKKPEKSNNAKKVKKSKSPKKIRREGPTLYSQEYLEKKHGIKISDKKEKKKVIKNKVNISSTRLGFYGSIVIYGIILVGLVGILNLTQSIIIYNFPFTEIYLEYLFETINNINILIKDFLSGY